MNEERRAFTGRMRDRRTKRRVRVADVLSRVLITGGGIGTIVAVTGVFVFLAVVVLPLFGTAEVRAANASAAAFDVASDADRGEPMGLGLDEYGVLGWSLWSNGSLDVFRLDDGVRKHTEELFPAGELTAASIPLLGDVAVFGLSDGSIQLTRIGFVTQFLLDDWVAQEVRDQIDELPAETPFDYEGGILQRTSQGQYRLQKLEIEPIRARRVADGPIRHIDHVELSRGPLIVALADSADGASSRLFAVQCHRKNDFATGGTTFGFDPTVPLPLDADASVPDFLAIAGTGKDTFLGWKSGQYTRIQSLAQLDDSFVAERGRLGDGAEIAFMDFTLGENTLLWGDAAGRVSAGFCVRTDDLADHGRMLAESFDPRTSYGLVRAKDLCDEGAAATSMDVSRRNRVAVCGFEDGEVVIFNVTNESRLASFHLPVGEPVLRLGVAPKEDLLLVASASGARLYEMDLEHPEADAASLFGQVWYEGYGEAEHTWQSSSGHTGFEPKFGLVPLIVGTLKATLYSMLFGAPLAVLAAIFSSEYLKGRTRAVVKPTIELMASLPSVVLGFLAAQVIAPFVDDVLPGALALMLCLPLAFAASAYLWQCLPRDASIRLARFRMAFFAPALALGIALSTVVGPALESLLFAGDVKGWLSWDGRPGGERFESAFGGFVVLLLPPCALVTALVSGRFVGPWLRAQSALRRRGEMARLDLVRALAFAALVVAGSATLSFGLDALGFDPRGSLSVWGIDFAPLGTYEQRNSLIVGFVMGFAVIPIIYTLADDALTSVPNHLRSASLACGATPWQTAVRIVLPTAMSGIFSALMIGLGRAVGETMIVLMATGNTPILDFNGFSGFRTLAANIAFELPEAVRDSTHYRTLFLAALVLFAITFAVNTAAESVRLRFRRRAYQL